MKILMLLFLVGCSTPDMYSVISRAKFARDKETTIVVTNPTNVTGVYKIVYMGEE